MWRVKHLVTILLIQEAKVIRSGTRQVINAEDLVVGDIVDVQFGDKIPADIRIIKSSGFKVQFCIVFV